QLYLAGMSLFAIQELLGHSWTGTTARYIHPRELHQVGEKPQVARSRRGPDNVSGLGMGSTWPGVGRRWWRVIRGTPVVREGARGMKDPPVGRSKPRVGVLQAHRRGEGIAVAGLRRPRQVFGPLEYPTPPKHVHATHVEDAWVAGQQRVADRWKGLAR